VKVVTETWWSESIGRTKSVNVVLPAAYAAVGKPFPVLYLLHSYGGNRNSWLQCPGLAALTDAHEIILVLPESGRSWLVNDARGRRYEDYLVDEVVGHVDAQFNTAAGRSGRAVAGFSMGGACAVFHSLRHPDLFSTAGSISGAFEAPLRRGDPYSRYRADRDIMMPTVHAHERVWGPPGSATRREYDPYRLLERMDATLPLEMRLDIGLHDYPRMVAMNRAMRDALLAHFVRHSYHEHPGGHDWGFVDTCLPALFAFVHDRVTVV
jgi:S-formylglutathione hydrolase